MPAGLVFQPPTPWHPVKRSVPATQSLPNGSVRYDSLKDAFDAFGRGEPVLVMDDESRENEGDLILAAVHATPEKLAWIIRYTSGFICVALPERRLDSLAIHPMVTTNTDPHKTAYAITVDYAHDTTTGISAADRALTLRALASSETRPSDFTRPGHVVPLRAHRGGILARGGHTEAAVELCLATGLPPAGALCEIVSEGAYEWEDNYGQPGREGGGMARLNECRAFADRWGIKMISVAMLVEWRQKHKTPEMTSVL